MTNDTDTLFSDENAHRIDEILKLREAESRRLAKHRPVATVGRVIGFRRPGNLPRIGKEDPVDGYETP